MICRPTTLATTKEIDRTNAAYSLLGSIEIMHPILAMGDLATPALFISLLFVDVILLVAIGILALSFWKRSLAALIIASVFVFIDIYIIVPFYPLIRGAFIFPLTEEYYKTPDLMLWCRVAAVIWLLFLTATLFYFIRVIKKLKGSRHAA